MNIFTSVVTDGYVDAFTHLLKSILKHNPDFKNSWYIICNEELNTINRDRIRKVYDNVRFWNLNQYKYRGVQKGFPRYWSLEAFNLNINPKEDKVIFMDSDLICMGKIDDLMKIDCDIGMVKEIRRPSFNAGLIVLKGSFIYPDLNNENKSLYEKLMDTDYRNREEFGTDQRIYNIYFKDKITALDHRFNVLVSEGEGVENPMFYHYIYKPWNPKVNDGQRKALKKYFDIWHSYDDIN